MNTFLLIVGITTLVAGIALWVTKKYCGMFKKVAVVSLILLGIALFLIGDSMVIIPTGYTGVRTTFGQIDSRPVPNGLNWRIPLIQSIKQVNNKQQDIVFNGTVWSETAERTALYYENVTVTYQINSEKSAWIYANVSDYKNNLVSPELVASAIKSSSKELNSTDATNRSIIEPLVQTRVQEALNQKYGENVVYVNKVVISNTDFEESYNQAIADKQTAQLAYEKQQIENKQKIEAAEAQAKVKTTEAKADAEASVIRAQGEADANKLLNDSITENILRQQYYNKWDGKLPNVVASDGNGLMMDLGNITSATMD